MVILQWLFQHLEPKILEISIVKPKLRAFAIAFIKKDDLKGFDLEIILGKHFQHRLFTDRFVASIDNDTTNDM